MYAEDPDIRGVQVPGMNQQFIIHADFFFNFTTANAHDYSLIKNPYKSKKQQQQVLFQFLFKI